MKINYVIAALVGAIAASALMVGITQPHTDTYLETQTAIKECERHLPRNQHCEYKITAEVKKK